jgi:hypothetical protein
MCAARDAVGEDVRYSRERFRARLVARISVVLPREGATALHSNRCIRDLRAPFSSQRVSGRNVIDHDVDEPVVAD